MGRDLTGAAGGLSRLAIGLTLFVAAAPSLGWSQPPTRAKDDATAVSGITVVARPELSGLEVNGRRLCQLDPPPGEKPAKPRIVDSYPKSGQAPPAGVIYLRVTYSERMSPCGFLLADALITPPPEFLSEPALLTRDYKTFYFAVRTKPGKTYSTWFNQHFSTPFFKTLYGVGAPAFELKFTTSTTAPPSLTKTQALAADPATPDLAPDPEKLLTLWVPREGDQGPECGACDKGALATDRGGPKELKDARGR